MGESCGEVAFANAGGTGDQQVQVLLDPGEIGELGKDCRIDTARRAGVEVLETGVLRQLGPAQTLRQAVVARSVISCWIRSPKRSSNERAVLSAPVICCSRAAAMPLR